MPTPGIDTAVAIAAYGVTGAALLCGAGVLVASRSVRAALPVLLDLLLAAGLLRLGSADTWTAIGTAAAIVALRKLVVTGLMGPVGNAAPAPSARPGAARAELPGRSSGRGPGSAG